MASVCVCVCVCVCVVGPGAQLAAGQAQGVPVHGVAVAPQPRLAARVSA
jgi:hypothetical protein